MDIPTLREIAVLEAEDLENCMLDYWTSNLAAAESELLDSYPARGPIIAKACAAHRASDYELSIPIFLIQADGICLERTGIQVYKRADETRLRIADYIDGIDAFAAAFLEPLGVPMPINLNSRERADAPHALNRHAVLHGESVEYPTQVNSLKAFSFLSFVGSLDFWTAKRT